MPEVYPCSLPLPLVENFSFEDQDLVVFNDLSSGPPIARAMSSQGYSRFNASFAFGALQMQVFRAFFRYKLVNGAKTFTIGLNIDGDTTEHTCYMRSPRYRLSGKRWTAECQLISIEQKGIDECEAESLFALTEGLDPVKTTLDDIEDLIENVM